MVLFATSPTIFVIEAGAGAATDCYHATIYAAVVAAVIEIETTAAVEIAIEVGVGVVSLLEANDNESGNSMARI